MTRAVVAHIEHGGRVGRGAVAALLAMGTLMGLGCRSIERVGVAPERLQESIDDALVSQGLWPARYRRPAEGVQGVIRELDLNAAPEPVESHAARVASRALEDEADGDAAVLGLDRPGAYLSEGPGSLVFFEDKAPWRQWKDWPPERQPTSVFKFISARRHAPLPRLRSSDRGRNVPVLELERTWFAFYDVPAPSRRGVVLLIPGMLGTPGPVIEALVIALRVDGWAILRMWSHPSRFTEKISFNIDPRDGLGEEAQRIADVLGNRAAECAYAAQAAFAHLENLDPRLRDAPRVGLGMSGGAMVMPTVIARESSRYAGAVLIGGGADFWTIADRSNYQDMIDAVRSVWTAGSPTERDGADLSAEYLRRAPLDPYHTAASLVGKPTLLLHAAADRAVPAVQGDLLWERLGRPERWAWPVGHEMLFVMLPGQFQSIIEWLDRSVPGAAAVRHSPSP
ncbi:MAG: hypothetical protein JNM07_00935 [Phycisphaerae bacterium]|nr:hypothetical protein [Phycisphaerae bacterium]